MIAGGLDSDFSATGIEIFGIKLWKIFLKKDWLRLPILEEIAVKILFFILLVKILRIF